MPLREIVLGRDVLIPHPESIKKFIINTEAIKMNLRGVMIQNGNPIDF